MKSLLTGDMFVSEVKDLQMCEKWQFRCAVSTNCWMVKVVAVVVVVVGVVCFIRMGSCIRQDRCVQLQQLQDVSLVRYKATVAVNFKAPCVMCSYISRTYFKKCIYTYFVFVTL